MLWCPTCNKCSLDAQQSRGMTPPSATQDGRDMFDGSPDMLFRAWPGSPPATLRTRDPPTSEQDYCSHACSARAPDTRPLLRKPPPPPFRSKLVNARAAAAGGGGATRGGHGTRVPPAAAVVRRALARERLRRQDAADGAVARPAGLDPGGAPSLRAAAANAPGGRLDLGHGACARRSTDGCLRVALRAAVAVSA